MSPLAVLKKTVVCLIFLIFFCKSLGFKKYIPLVKTRQLRLVGAAQYVVAIWCQLTIEITAALLQPLCYSRSVTYAYLTANASKCRISGLVAEIMLNFQHLSNICPILDISWWSTKITREEKAEHSTVTARWFHMYSNLVTFNIVTIDLLKIKLEVLWLYIMTIEWPMIYIKLDSLDGWSVAARHDLSALSADS